MSEIAEIVRNYDVIRERLYHPPNAVLDKGINLRKSNSIPEPEHHPRVVVTVFEYDPNPKPLPPLVFHRVKFKNVLRAVSKVYKVGIRDIMDKSRRPAVVFPRQVAAYLGFKHSRISSMQIGEKMHRDHTTILFSRDKIEHLLKTDTNLQNDIKLIEEILFR